MKRTLAIFVITLFTFTTYSQTPFAQYPCNGNGNDTTSNGNDGVLTGGSIVADRYGEPFAAIEFDGNDYIQVPHSNSLMFTSSFSISAWFKTSMSGVGIIAEKFNGMANGVKDAGYTLAINTNEILFIVYSGTGTSVDPPDAYRISSGISLSDNKWHQATGVWDDNKDTIFLYIDGVLRAQKYCPVPPGANTRPLMIGKRYNNDLYYEGVIDDVRIFSSSLTNAEVDVNYSGVNEKFNMPVCYFDLQNEKIISPMLNQVSADIYSLDGKLVHKESFVGQLSLDFLQSGLYIVKLVDEGNEVSYLEILIN